MKVTTEKDIYLKDFDAWSGAVDTLNALKDDQISILESILENEYPDGIDETHLNDFLWFENDTIADWLGFKSWEALERANEYGDEITVRIYDIEWDLDEDEEEENPDLPTEVIHTFDGCFEGIKDDELIDEISDWLSDEYGYCHNGFEVKEI